MKFKRTDGKNFTVIKLLAAKLDFGASKELKEHFNHCKRKYIEKVILDLSICDNLSSEGIGLIMYMWQHYKEDGKMYYVFKSDLIIDLLKMSGIYAEMRESIFSDVDEAKTRIVQKTPTLIYDEPGDKKSCPHCNGENIVVYDRGLKKTMRFLKGKKIRYICRDCTLVWR